MASRAEPMAWRSSVRAGAARSGAMLLAVALLLLTAALAVSLASYTPGDPGLNTAAAGPARNWLGSAGAYAADALFTLFGVIAALVLPLGLLLGVRLWRGHSVAGWPRMMRDVAIGAVLMGTALAFVAPGSVLTLPAGYGGAVAMAIAAGLRFLIGLIGDPVIELWTARSAGVLAALAGIILWGRGMTIDWRDRAARMRRIARREEAAPEEAPTRQITLPDEDEIDAPPPA